MRTRLFIVTILIFATRLLASSSATDSPNLSAVDEKPVVLQRYGVSFKPPRGWFTPSRDKIVENIKKLAGDTQDVQAILATHRGSIAVATYLKEDPRHVAGMVPTINVIARPNPHREFEGFRAAIEEQAKNIGGVLRNHVLKTAPAEQNVGGRRVMSFESEFTLATAAGGSYNVTSTTYAIPCGEIFLQVSMNEGLPVKQAGVFDEFISFRFDKP